MHDWVRQSIRDTPASQPVMIILDDLDDLAVRVAGEANHAHDKMLEKKLDRISRKIGELLDSYTYESESAAGGTIHRVDPVVGNEPTSLPKSSKSKKGGEQYPLKLTDKEREAIIHATRLRRGLKNKIDQSTGGTEIIGFTKKELDEMAEEVETSLEFVPQPYKKQLVAVRDNLDDLLDALEEDEPLKPDRKPVPKADRIYQFRITLKAIKPPIWRVVQVPDCSLGDLHEVIQTVMGWKDCHLHQFIINGEYYGSPDELDLDTKDEDGVLLGQVIKGNRRARFRYDYDLAAGWQHEVCFEHDRSTRAQAQVPSLRRWGQSLPTRKRGRAFRVRRIP